MLAKCSRAFGGFSSGGAAPLMFSLGGTFKKRQGLLAALKALIKERAEIIGIIADGLRQLLPRRERGEGLFMSANPLKEPRRQESDLRLLAKLWAARREIEERRLIPRAADKRLEVAHRIGRIRESKRERTDREERDQRKGGPHA